MSSFFRIAIYICLGLICFNLGLAFISTLNVFPSTITAGKPISSTDNALAEFTGATGNMNYIWGLVLAGAVIGGVLAVLTQSLIPIGISIFATVFWATYIRTLGIISIGGYIPGEFLIIFSVVMVFVFIAAIIGMITGSG